MTTSFQDLPWDIAYAIVRHVADKNQCAKAGMLSYRQPGLKFVSPLLKVSHTWRSATQAYLYQIIDIKLSHYFPQALYKYRRWPTCMNTAVGYGFKLVKTANLKVNISTIATGEALKLLIELPTAIEPFRTARTLNITIYCSRFLNDKQPAATEYWIHLFCNQLNIMFPGVKNINVVYDENYPVETPIESKLANILVYNLLSSATNTSLQLFTGSQIAALDGKAISNLTSLNASWCKNHKEIAKLIQLNSQCLHTLTIKFVTFEGFQNIVHNGESFVCYPAMKKLHFESSDGAYSPLMAYRTKGLLFPKLHQLNLEINYPFNDDTLFRGNSSTLDYLRIMPNTAVFQMLAAQSTFAKSKYNLSYLSIKEPNYRMMNIQWHVLDLQKFINKFSTTLKGLLLPSISEELEILQPEIISYSTLIPRNLSKLEFTYKNLNINEIIVIVKEVPKLASLICGYKNIGLQNIDSEYLENKYTSYCPLNTSLWHWCASSYDGYIHMATIECALILAILCPNYTLTKDSNYTSTSFNNYLLDLKKQSPFDKYSESIDRILIKNIPNSKTNYR
ncbi:hypothetical protein COEREDRAFT_87852 [Coemansia reversa NRRL 1564]|uniref:F-box domain-containing protein n=1 Tax=Coemansia reversa (strain ATCC 12441 / NRRL 1564) TaxID=763665 RepID=A0A2G5B8V0_COERN|nr:hypothetical protein COEREDRAFT_87852 [Coemansia reversa NRRL 1564]|eukprot:PIA15439.1 hypothetical protein COEREDRAFT_87852 [Coemansia reversa NRRL 1564]